MFYLTNRHRRVKRAHYWTGKDTYCRMFGTGGMNRNMRFYQVTETPEGRPICTMCAAVAAKAGRDVVNAGSGI